MFYGCGSRGTPRWRTPHGKHMLIDPAGIASRRRGGDILRCDNRVRSAVCLCRSHTRRNRIACGMVTYAFVLILPFGSISSWYKSGQKSENSNCELVAAPRRRVTVAIAERIYNVNLRLGLSPEPRGSLKSRWDLTGALGVRMHCESCSLLLFLLLFGFRCALSFGRCNVSRVNTQYSQAVKPSLLPLARRGRPRGPAGRECHVLSR